MKKGFRKFLAYLLVLMMLSTNIAAVADALAVMTLPAALQIIDEEAFCGNTSIGKVIVPEGTTEIRSRAFADSSLAEIDLPGSLTFIAEDAFDGCGLVAIYTHNNQVAVDFALDHGIIALTD